jgi:uncharacterized membrane protein YgcG
MLTPRQETTRLVDHFEVALGHLRSLPTKHLSRLQQLVRTLLVGELDAYAEDEFFPRNEVSKERTPVFVDGGGRPCAVAHLLAQSGEYDLLTSIATRSNTERVTNFEALEPLIDWLDAAGLTLEDAMIIQPSYDHVPTYQGECFCGGNYWTKLPGRGGARVRAGYQGVVEVVGLGDSVDPMSAEVVATYGTTNVMIGAVVRVNTNATKGARFLIPYGSEYAGQMAALDLKGSLQISEGGTVTCEVLSNSPPVPKEVIARSIQLESQACIASLAMDNPFWSQEYMKAEPKGASTSSGASTSGTSASSGSTASSGGSSGGCSIGSAGESAGVLVLLALMASRLGRVVRRSSVKRGTQASIASLPIAK